VGTGTAAYTWLPNSIFMESTTTEGAPVERGLANAIGDSRENDRDGNTLITCNSLRVHSFQVVESRQNLAANQSN